MNHVGRIEPAGAGCGGPDKPRQSSGQGFKDIWAEACDQHKLKFSKHAMERLGTRKVALGNSHLERLDSAVERAGRKGARESLVLLDELAFVVSVRNRTVITALQPSKDGVFTSIDSAVIA